MVEKKQNIDFGIIGYAFGVISIVMAFFTPLAGVVFGIIGIIQSKKQKTELSKKAKKLSIIGLVLSIILFIASIAVALYFTSKSISGFGNFPVA